MDLVRNHLYNSLISPNVPTTSSCFETIHKLLSTTKNEISETIPQTPSTKETSQQNRDVSSSNFLPRSHVCSHSETHEEKTSADSKPQIHPTNISSVEKDIEVCIRELLKVQENFRKNRENLSSNETKESGLDVNCNTLSSRPGTDNSEENYEPDTINQLAALKGCIKNLRRSKPDAVHLDKVEEVECAGEMVEINIFSKSDTPEADVRHLNSPKQYNINKVERVILTPRTTIIKFDIGTVREAKADMITDHRVLQAAENILLAKIDWSRDHNIRSLMSEKSRLDHEMKIIKNKKKLIETRLIEERKLKAEEIEQIQNANIREKLEEQAKVERFVLHLVGRDETLEGVLDQLKAGRLSDVVKRLLHNFDVRLLGVDCGLNFLLEGPVTLKNRSMLRQLEKTLEELLPENQRNETKWENGEWDLTHTKDLEVGKVSPVLMQVATDDSPFEKVTAENNAFEDVGVSNESNWVLPQESSEWSGRHFSTLFKTVYGSSADRELKKRKHTSSAWNKIKGAVWRTNTSFQMKRYARELRQYRTRCRQLMSP